MRCFNYLQLQNLSEFENLDRTQGGIRIQNTDPNQKPVSRINTDLFLSKSA